VAIRAAVDEFLADWGLATTRYHVEFRNLTSFATRNPKSS
jgi:hypothetical protein